MTIKKCIYCRKMSAIIDGDICQECSKKIQFSKSILDSGKRRTFESGAVRDIQEGKGRCDLLPLDVVGKLFFSADPGNLMEPQVIDKIFYQLNEFIETKNPLILSEVIIDFCLLQNISIHTMLLETSKHYEEGAKKYSENNWKKGIPLHCYIDSGVRHLLKHLRGDTDEPHNRAFVWNMLGAMWTITHKPELDDIQKDI